MFTSKSECHQNSQVVKYTLTNEGKAISYANAIELWQISQEFRSYMTFLLVKSEFGGFRWETPPITTGMLNRPFEFVLLNAPGFVTRPTDIRAFSQYFTNDDTDNGIVAFQNIGKDATLIVPSPRGNTNAYGHFAAFIRNAPATQVNSLWRVVGRSLASQISEKPLWLSTAGGGVAWLHVRIDTFPKYYGFKPFTHIVK
jgi:hypothetical protein